MSKKSIFSEFEIKVVEQAICRKLPLKDSYTDSPRKRKEIERIKGLLATMPEKSAAIAQRPKAVTRRTPPIRKGPTKKGVVEDMLLDGGIVTAKMIMGKLGVTEAAAGALISDCRRMGHKVDKVAKNEWRLA